MRKILIIGDDVHAEHYVNTILFRNDLELYISNVSKKIKTESFGKLYNWDENVNIFDYIIYTIPLKFDLDIFDKLKGYNGTLLIEKMQRKLDLIDLLNCNVYFVHLRDFDENIGKVNIGIKNNINWPNLTNQGMNHLLHTLPNVLDYINGLGLNKNNFQITNKVYKNKDLFIELLCNDKIRFYINIYSTNDEKKLPVVNGVVIPWPNYFNCITNLIDNLINGNLEYEYSKKREKIYNELIEKE